MDATTRQRIEELLASSPVFVFMKGNKLMPQCGFSNNVVQILHAAGVPFETFDVLSVRASRSFPSGPPSPRCMSKENSSAAPTS